MTGDWRPTASMEALRTRAQVLELIREFFAERGVLEVETPLLASAPVTDPHLAALSTRYRGPGHDDGRRLWLQTSPEFAMKRLLATGSGPIYQLCKAFRDGEAGSRHNPEFTMLEWYRPGWDHHRLMDEVAGLLAVVLGGSRGRDSSQRQGQGQQSGAEAEDRDSDRDSSQLQGQKSAAATGMRSGGASRFSPDGRVPGSDFVRREQSCVPGIPSHRLERTEKLTYAEVFLRHAGIEPHIATVTELVERAASLIGASLPDLGEDRIGWLDLLMSHIVEPELGRNGATFIYDYPASQAALARIRPGDPPVAERFETWIEGIELANGYHELTDPGEQRRRFDADLAGRRKLGLSEVPVDHHLLAALEHGLPECAGVALGVDRLVMLAAGAKRIEEVIAFPVDRA